jgi:hypothetical protein
VSLAEKLTVSPAREVVVKDCVSLIDDEVKAKGGFSGIAIKGAYGVVKTFKPGFVRDVVDGLLDQWVAKLEPFYEKWQKDGGGKSFTSFLEGRRGDVAEALLEVTDAKSQKSTNNTVKKMYAKMRPGAKRNVEEAMPRLGAALEKHLGEKK